MGTLTEAASSDSPAAAAGTTEWPARPRCTCDCGCHRKPGRRIICPGCYRYIGPGCCWHFAHQMCHVCFQWGWPEPEPETQPLFFEHQHETENRYVGQITKPQNMYAPDGTPDRRGVADKLSDGRRNLSQVFPSSKKGRGKRTTCKGKGRQSNRVGPDGACIINCSATCRGPTVIRKFQDIYGFRIQLGKTAQGK